MEEACLYALANGFTYYMDERDKDWLDKNNEEARGEGTSAQGSVSTSGTRVSARSAKAKGKEPDVSQPLVITEDEFELLMGLFEKVTHEKTEFLHHVRCAVHVFISNGVTDMLFRACKREWPFQPSPSIKTRLLLLYLFLPLPISPCLPGYLSLLRYCVSRKRYIPIGGNVALSVVAIE